MKNTIYTHDIASQIVESFENILCQNGIKVPSPEDDEREEDNVAALYGSVYSDLLDEVEWILIEMLNRAKDAEVVTYEYSGNW
jgi:hypothetical protein